MASVDLNTHPGSAQPMVRYVTHVKVEITFGGYAKSTKSKPQGNPKFRTSRKDQYEVGTEHAPYYQSDFEFEEDCIQIEFSKGTFNKGTDGPKGNIMFDEVTNTQALGDLTLSNRAGKVQVTRFKLRQWGRGQPAPCGHLLQALSTGRIGIWKHLETPGYLWLLQTNLRIKQLGSVRLRVQVGEFERVCKFLCSSQLGKTHFWIT